MTPGLFWNNALNWAAQVVLLSAFAWLATLLFRMHSASMRLRWYQAVLGLVVMLPLLVPPVRNMIVVEAGTTDGVTVVTHAGRAGAGGLESPTIAALVAGAGILLRIIWLCVGFLRLRQHRRASIPAGSMAGAELRISSLVSGPVTFGFFRPIVLLPANFEGLTSGQQDAILCHELMHVRRRDWLWMLGEELVRTVLWFHPAVWWLTSEIRLAREQAVDAEVISLTRTRDEYVDALLTFANVVPTPFAAPVPGFIRRRHLKQRVINILKEVHMSRTRSISTGLAASIALAAVAWFTTTSLPLRAQPQLMADTPGVIVNTNGAPLQHRIPVGYPRAENGSQAAGTVLAEVRLDASGNVADARILSGPDELRKPVLQSVLSWHFAKSVAGSVQQVAVTFQPQAAPATPVGGMAPNPMPAGPAATVRQVTVRGLPEQAQQELTASLPIRAGDPVTAETMQKLATAARKYDEHLMIGTSSPKGANEVDITIATPGAPPAAAAIPAGAIRVGGNAAQAKLINQPKPAYPPLAKAARIQGVVTFEVIIDKEGRISNLHLVSGPPLLVQSAMQAVQQWTYQPTLLNGNPVEIVTTIDVNYTLSDNPQGAAQ